MSKSHTQATTLRPILGIAVFMSIVIIIGGFYFAQDYLRTLATEKGGTTAAKSTSFQTDTQIKADISTNQATVDKASAFITSSQTYQSQAFSDLNNYASATGVSISSQSSTSAPSTEPSSSFSNGVQANYIKIGLNNPVNYSNLLKFISAIETNLPKMQLTGIGITPSANNKTSVNVEPLIIKVYTK